jgi:hypothetical protein
MAPLWGAGTITRQTFKVCAAFTPGTKGAAKDMTGAALTGAPRRMFGGFGAGLKAAPVAYMSGLVPGWPRLIRFDRGLSIDPCNLCDPRMHCGPFGPSV